MNDETESKEKPAVEPQEPPAVEAKEKPVSEVKEKPASELKEQGPPESWLVAREFADLLGTPNSLFTTAVRAVRNLGRQGGDWTEKLEQEVIQKHPTQTLFYSATFRSIVYHAAQALHGKDLKGLAPISLKGLLSLFDSDELAMIIALSYLYRNIRKVCPQQVWDSLSKEVHLQMETGFLIGKAIPAIGTGKGVIMGAIRYLAMGLYAKENYRSFRSFMRRLDEGERLFNVDEEVLLWECNHLQVAAILLQSIGFGIPAAKGVSYTVAPTATPGKNDEEAVAWYAAKAWIESLLEREEAPKEFEAGSPFHLEHSGLAALQRQIENLFENGTTFDWVDKTREDLAPKILNALKKSTAPAQETGDLDPYDHQEGTVEQTH